MSFWDQRYDTKDYVFGTAPNAFLARQAERLKGFKTALAIADGEGRNGVWLAEQGLDVTSLDNSPVGLKKAEALAASRGVQLTPLLADIGAFDWTARAYDAVVGIFFQFAPPDMRAAIFAGMKQAVRPGGLILIEGYRPEQLAYGTGGPREIDNLYTEPLLREAFGDFEITTLQSYDAELSEGAGHKGPSAVIDLVARRPVLG